MNRLVSFLLFAVVGTVFVAHNVCNALTDDVVQGYETAFIQYQIKFDKHYDSKEEYDRRLRAYAKSMERIKMLNIENSKKGVQFGETPRCDLLDEELHSFALKKEVIEGSSFDSQDKETHNVGASHKFNRLPQPKLARNHTEGNMPSEFSWFNVSGVKNPASDQGSCGSCWAFSAIGALEMQSVLEGNPFLGISKQQGIDCALGAKNCGCCGGWPGYIFDNVKKYTLEEEYPYLLSRWKNSSGCCPYSCNSNNYSMVLGIRGYDEFFPMSSNDLKKQIWMYGPISVHMETNEAFNYYTGGILDCTNFTSTGSHMVIAVGFGPGYIALRNSWGREWGLDGDFLVSDVSEDASCHILAPKENCCKYLQMVRVSVKSIEDGELDGSVLAFVGCFLYLPILGAAFFVFSRLLHSGELDICSALFPISLGLTVLGRAIWLFSLRIDDVLVANIMDGLCWGCFFLFVCSFLDMTARTRKESMMRNGIASCIVALTLVLIIISVIINAVVVDGGDATTSTYYGTTDPIARVTNFVKCFSFGSSALYMIFALYNVIERFWCKVILSYFILMCIISVVVMMTGILRIVMLFYYIIEPPYSIFESTSVVLLYFIPELIPMYYSVWYIAGCRPEDKDPEYESINGSNAEHNRMEGGFLVS